MNITKKKDGTTLTIALEGYLDTQTAPLLDAEIQKGLDGAETLIYDFSELNYMTSAGIRVLLISRDMLPDSGEMKVLHANDNIRNALKLTGLEELLGD